jgi:hypothetical protein
VRSGPGGFGCIRVHGAPAPSGPSHPRSPRPVRAGTCGEPAPSTRTSFRCRQRDPRAYERRVQRCTWSAPGLRARATKEAHVDIPLRIADEKFTCHELCCRRRIDALLLLVHSDSQDGESRALETAASPSSSSRHNDAMAPVARVCLLGARASTARSLSCGCRRCDLE